MQDYSKELKMAKQAALESGKLLKKGFFSLKQKDIRMKSKTELVTKYDIAAEKIIKNLLKKKFPGHDFLGEESGRTGNKSDFLWVTDPLDGTTNFSIKNPFFNTSIALFNENEPVLGVIYFPILDELFWAVKNKGAYLNRKKISVSAKNELLSAIVMFCGGKNCPDIGSGIFSRLLPNVFNMRLAGAAALELAYVAAGRVEAFYYPGAKLWDIGAGSLLVREAGGKVTDFDGIEWSDKSKDLVASNGRIHEVLVEKIMANK